MCRYGFLVFLFFVNMIGTAINPGDAAADPSFGDLEWREITDDAEWDARAGLQVVQFRNRLYLMGGRTPLDPATSPAFGASQIWGDVWTSSDQGLSWYRLLETDDTSHWPARAYFQAVTKGRHMYVIGGQNFKVIPNPSEEGPPFLSVSDFFNDVWRSRDGVSWEQVSSDAGWEGRAGLSAVSFKGRLYVMGGSVNDDSAVIGGPPVREYFNDVWVSKTGERWKRLTEHASWAPRAGGVLVVKNGYMWMIGGEDGFTCASGGDRCPPYFNDVWRSRDGKDWELVTENADWMERPGHQVVVMHDHFVLFGGFGLSPDPANPFAPANPMDVWVSRNGQDWQQVDDAPWNAVSPADVKYDFDALVVSGGRYGRRPTVLTFGGDRETFNPFDPVNFLRIDNDVWEYTVPTHWFDAALQGPALQLGGESPSAPGADLQTQLRGATPNPFNPQTTISFSLSAAGRVRLAIYDVAGRLVATLADGLFSSGRHALVWNGQDETGRHVVSGVYLYKLEAGSYVETRRMTLLK
jgi:hypothetical protein